MMAIKLTTQELEAREVPASFGIPWSSQNLTLSFAPDGVNLGGITSDLHASLNNTFSPAVWQREVLLAYQTWTQHTNLSIGLVSDQGQPFGTAGRWTNDPRFGDIRIAGANLGGDQLAVGTPSDPGLAGTRAGDVILNTAYQFNGVPYDLRTVMIHEAAHSLGLGNVNHPLSILYTQYTGLRHTLHESDVAAIQELYGVRLPDQHEGTLDNNATSRATQLGQVANKETIQLSYGDLTSHGDVDVYSVLTPAGSEIEDITVKIQSSGYSLLSAKIEVYFIENGNEVQVGNTTMDPISYTGGAASVTFDGNADNGPRQFYVRVTQADGTAFGIGKYAIGVSYLEDDGFIDTDLLTLEGGPRPVLLNVDNGANNTLDTATVLSPKNISTTTPNNSYEVLGSLSASTDIDIYRMQTPGGIGPRVATINVQVLDGLPNGMQVQLLDSNGQNISYETIVNNSSGLTVQALNLSPGSNYFVRLAGNTTGSYRLTTNFGTQASLLATFADGDLEVGVNSVMDTLYVARAQAMQFNLNAGNGTLPVRTGVRLTMLDLTGNTIFSIVSQAGEIITSPTYLMRPGEYRIRIEALRPVGFTGAIPVTIRGTRLDDPIGAIPTDPTFRPRFPNPNGPGFQYPGGFTSLNPFLWLTLLR